MGWPHRLWVVPPKVGGQPIVVVSLKIAWKWKKEIEQRRAPTRSAAGVVLTCRVCPARRRRTLALRRASVRTRPPTSTGRTDRFPRDSRATCARPPKTLAYPRGSLKHTNKTLVYRRGSLKTQKQNPSVSEGSLKHRNKTLVYLRGSLKHRNKTLVYRREVWKPETKP